MKSLHEMNRLEALQHFLARAKRIEDDYKHLFNDLAFCEQRWPGHFTADKAQVHSEYIVARHNVARLQKQLDDELSKSPDFSHMTTAELVVLLQKSVESTHKTDIEFSHHITNEIKRRKQGAT